MPTRPSSSRTRYSEYRSRRRDAAPEQSADALESKRDERGRRKPTRPFFALLRAFWGLLRGHRLTMAAALGTLSAATIISLVMPASTKVVIDYILTDNPGPAGIPEWMGLPESRSDLLWILAGALVVAAGLSVTIGTWGRWQMTRLTKRMQILLRRRAFDRAVRLPLHRVQQIKSGGVASILREDAGGAGELVFSMIYNPWRAVVQLCGTMLILAVVDWRLLLGAIALIPTIWVTHKTWINRIRPVYRDIRHSRQGIDSVATEVFGGMRVVRSFNRERGEGSSFVRRNHFMIRQEILAWWRSRAIEIAWQILIPLASVGVLLYGGHRVLDGTLTIGDVMMFSAYLLMLLSPLETLAATAAGVQNNLAGFDRLLDLFEEKSEFEGVGSGRAVDPARAQGRITFDSVWFRYPGAEADVLREISIDVRPGEVIALVGPSGSGKTTLCNLVARFYDPTRGAVRLDGEDLREFDVRSYRSLLGVVEQDVFLFDGSVAENIAYARPQATQAEIEHAAIAANAHGFITELELGYETLIGERGVRLSGGQKQRIAIARAILADPRILILDEATSNLDSESEALIQRSMTRLMRGRTCFVIAHRLSTIRHADRIVVLEDGAVSEIGSHDELSARGGRYADLLRMQIQGDEDESDELADAAAD